MYLLNLCLLKVNLQGWKPNWRQRQRSPRGSIASWRGPPTDATEIVQRRGRPPYSIRLLVDWSWGKTFSMHLTYFLFITRNINVGKTVFSKRRQVIYFFNSQASSPFSSHHGISMHWCYWQWWRRPWSMKISSTGWRVNGMFHWAHENWYYLSKPHVIKHIPR